MLDQRDVRLVVTDDPEDVLRLDGCRQTLCLAQRGRGFLDAASHGKNDPRLRVDERGVSHLLVTEPQFVVRKPYVFGIVGQLGLAQRAPEQRDGPRLVAARKRDPTVKAPQRREKCGRKVVARRIGRTPKGGGG